MRLAGRQRPQVTTCRRAAGGTWRLLAEHGFLGVGSTSILAVGATADGGSADADAEADGVA